jgi:transcriptional regulator with XRE-family HTH domain
MAQQFRSSESPTPSALVGARMRELRDGRGWSAQRLADELAQVGIKWDRSIVANLESGRRASVSVEELLALAYVFGVAPVHLLVPVDERPYPIVPTDEYPTSRVRAWVRGEQSLKGERTYDTEVPPDEWLFTRERGGTPDGYSLLVQEMKRMRVEIEAMAQDKRDSDGTR